MAKFTGDQAEFTFASTQYLCLTDYQWSSSVEEAVSRCSGSSGAVTHRATGATDNTFTFSVITDAGDTTTLNALLPGTSGTFEFHPEGDTANNIEMVATLAYVTSLEMTGATGQHNIHRVTFGIDGTLTIQAAS